MLRYLEGHSRSPLQYDTIEKILEREEKLNDLVDKSEGLSMQSKAFYKTVSTYPLYH